MKRTTLMIGAVLLPVLFLVPQAGRAAEIAVILRDVSGGRAVGKAELARQRVEVKVAGLAPTTEYTVTVEGPFAQGPIVVGRFLTGPRGEAKFTARVTDINPTLVEGVAVRRSDGGGGALILRGLVR